MAVTTSRIMPWTPAWRLDGLLMILLIVLMSLGLFVLYSAGEQEIGLVWRQAVRLAMGLMVLIVVAHLPPRLLQIWAPWLFVLALILLAATLVFGVGRGAQRWLDLGIVRFQPSEAMKLALPIMLATFLARRPLPPRWADSLLALILIAVPVLLIVTQPDLGTAVLVAASGLILLFLAGLRWRLIGLMALGLTAALPLLWVNLHAYQQNRVLTFLNPERDPLGQGWNIIQSKIAVGSGGLTGKGWQASSQSHLEFLPEPHTDFIFSVLAEEFGFIGVIGVLVLYAAVILRSLYMASRCRDSFGRLLAGSLAMMFFLYAAVNIAMVSGLLPVVGVPLPLVSYGGTSAVTLLAGFGLIMGLYSRRRFMDRL
ncbi:rod shape-determining protein RodA [Wenzhouxiangella limi]|uniref:Peptidoglycan glycosyltransferase MrdB n=1 Tax=Wenzhouxiangella limi TaxID=2707351 RepID=A0A845VES5_9GAMM|nr:rod shape-determining protein RodA [Wenzhouxiangella limi]NDY95739.1 rod shape-determining protein RodA [Wenzhouxiangella limi]